MNEHQASYDQEDSIPSFLMITLMIIAIFFTVPFLIIAETMSLIRKILKFC